jgi:hypothetical protein
MTGFEDEKIYVDVREGVVSIGGKSECAKLTYDLIIEGQLCLTESELYLYSMCDLVNIYSRYSCWWCNRAPTATSSLFRA